MTRHATLSVNVATYPAIKPMDRHIGETLTITLRGTVARIDGRMVDATGYDKPVTVLSGDAEVELIITDLDIS